MADVHISESGTVVFDADASHDDLTQHTDGAFAVSVPGADGTASTATVNGISSSTGAPDIVTDLRLTKADLADAFAPAVNGREDTGAPAATHNPMAQPRDALNGDSHPPTHDMNSKASSSARDDEERDAQAEAMVIDSLRMQVQDLYTQVSQLNSKLVRSYDRVSDLEDDLHVASTSSRSSALKIAQLELERSQHLSALNTGLLVERSAVAAELTNIMERATAEAARAGKAENARHEIERELDDLSAGLFGQANSMVAQARFAAAGSERKVEEAELALRAAEDAVAAMQRQMQQLQAEKEAAETEAERVRVSMGKGKWIESDATAPSTKAIRLLSSHNPYQEFLLFVAHLRSIRPVSAHPPAMATLLPLPFPARLQAEDSDPTVRLDLAPSLNWLSRRSVLAAIHGGELTIEPMPASTLIQELSPQSYSSASLMPGAGAQTHNIACALCGTAIFPVPASSPGPRHPLHPSISRTSSAAPTWSAVFKNTVASTNGTTPGTATPPVQGGQLYQERPNPTTIFVFRVTAAPAAGSGGTAANKAPYPLCASGWCLARLRTTCSLWAFVRTALVERVWEEEAPVPPPAPPARQSTVGAVLAALPTALPGVGAAAPADKPSEKPPLPARRSKIGGFWGMAAGALSAGVERARSATSGTPGGGPLTPEKEEPKAPSTPPRPPRARTAPGASVSPGPGSAPASPAPPPVPARSKQRETHITPLAAATPAEEKPIVLNGPAAPALISPPAADTPAFLTPAEHEADPMETTDVLPSKSEEGTLAAPSAVPLPESAGPSPSTPKGPPHSTSTEALQTDTTTSSAKPPSRTASPAPAIPPRSATRAESPAPAGSSTPPPIPRRAAARAARPLSMAAQAASNASTTAAASSGGDNDATVQVARPSEDSETDRAPVPSADASSASEPIADSAPAAEPSADAAPPSESAAAAAAPPVTNVGPPAEATSAQDAPAPPSENVTSIDVPAPPAEDAAEGQTARPAAEAAPAAEAIPVAAAEDEKPMLAAPVPQRPASILTQSPTHIDGEEEPQSAISPQSAKTPDNEAHDGEVYVGAVTWEERAWKELARLREDMFWARVGGVR